jgi:hypothetical protein
MSDLQKDAWVQRVFQVDPATLSAPPIASRGPAGPEPKSEAAPPDAALSIAAAPGGKAKRAPASSLGSMTPTSGIQMIDNLVYLASPTFYRATGKPGPAKLAAVGDPSADALLAKAADVVTLWADPKTLPTAVTTWRGIESPLRALIAKLQDPKGLGFEAQAVKPALEALDKIADTLSMQDVDLHMSEAVKSAPTPELSLELDARELKQLEPALAEWRKVANSGSQLVSTPEMKKLSQAADLYFANPDPMKKLHAFQQSHLLAEGQSLKDLSPFIIHMMVAGQSSIIHGGMRLAHAAGEAGHAAEKTLGQRLGVVGRFAGGAAYEMVKGAQKLISGIEEGDWHEIAEGGTELAMGTLGVGEAAGVVSGSTSAMLSGAAVVAWATFDAILMAAEIAKWGRQMTEQTAFKVMVADARKLVPLGKKLSAAVDLANETELAGNSLDADNNDRYQQIATKAAAELGAGLKALLDKHFRRSDPHAVGGYPAMVKPVLPMLTKAYGQIMYEKPDTLVEAFDATVSAIQAMLAAEAAANPVE